MKHHRPTGNFGGIGVVPRLSRDESVDQFSTKMVNPDMTPLNQA